MEGSETKHLSYHALVEVLDGDGCPFCSLVLSAMERYFSTVVYEQVNDIDFRATLRASPGDFEYRHQWRRVGTGAWLLPDDRR